MPSNRFRRLSPALLGAAALLTPAAASAQCVAPPRVSAEATLAAANAFQAEAWNGAAVVYVARIADIGPLLPLEEGAVPPPGRRVVLESLLTLKGEPAARYLDLTRGGAGEICPGPDVPSALLGRISQYYVVYARVAGPTGADVIATVPVGDLRDAATLQAWATAMAPPAAPEG